jgi:Short C-terminal domain
MRRMARRTARRTSRRMATQQDQAAPGEPEQQAAPAPAPAPQQVAAPEPPASAGISTEAMTRLEELSKLHDSGVLTDEEFAQQKAEILAT